MEGMGSNKANPDSKLVQKAKARFRSKAVNMNSWKSSHVHQKPSATHKKIKGNFSKSSLTNIDKFSSQIEKLPFLSSKFLPMRLIIASAIFVFVLIFRRMPDYAEIPLLILSALLAGVDLLPAFVSKIYLKKFSDPSVSVIISVFIGFCIGFATESSATVILYKIGLLLISYTTEKTAQSALELIDSNSGEIIESYNKVADDDYSDHLRLGSVALKSAGTVFKVALIVAVLYAILLPLTSNFSFRVSLHRAATIILIANPLSAIAAISPVGRVGLGSAASKGFIFRSADLLEDISTAQTIIFDNDLLEISEGLRIETVKTDSTDKETFLNLLYNLVYNSKQYFAEVIKKTYNYEYIPQIITDFKDIEGFGVEGKINSVPVYFGTSGFIKSRGIFTPELYGENDKEYFLALGNKCIGLVTFSRIIQEQSLNYSNILSDIHMQSSAKCFIITSETEERAHSLAEKFGFDAAMTAYGNYEKQKAVENICSALKRCSVYISPNGGEEHSAATIDLHPGTELINEDVIAIPGYMSNYADVLSISKNISRISRQNVVFSLAVKALLIFLCLIGYCNLWFAVYIDMAAALATILNAIRVAKK